MPNDKIKRIPRSFLHSFWAVFTLPFRAVAFAFRKLSEIPLKDLLIMGAIFVGLVFITLVLTVELTSQPQFCVTCHYMKPYFASWEKSSHKDVHCTKCHFPPGVKGTVVGKFTAIAMVANYVTGVYKKSKPWAEVSDESCLREGCHQTRLLQGKVPFKEGIVFDHTPHLTKDRRGKHLRCTSCHSQIVQGTHIAVTEETCFLCHFKDQPENAPMTACTKCHAAPVAKPGAQVTFDHANMVERQVNCRLCHGNMAVGDGNVPRERCSYCHAEMGKIDQYSNTVLIHEKHISEHKVECNHCHNSILHRSIARTAEIKPDCQGCHIDRHVAQYDLFTGQGARGVIPTPSTMFHAGLGCRACHVLLPPDWQENPSHMTRKAGPASCEPCHEPAYFRLFEQARPVLDNRIKSAQNRIAILRKGRSQNPATDSVLAACEFDLNLMVTGHPVHNPSYTDRILSEINLSLDKIEGKAPIARSLPDTVSQRCMRCHYGQDEALVAYGNQEFPHKIHVQGQNLGCTTCHQEAPVHGELKKDVGCMECHHRSAAISCEPCHQRQRDLREAKGLFANFQPDPMVEAGLTCRDCHTVEGFKVAKPDESICGNCHEPNYWKELQLKQADFEKQSSELGSALRKAAATPERAHAQALLKALKADGSRGGHNSASWRQILDEIRKGTGATQTSLK